jgi:hypothetical protein
MTRLRLPIKPSSSKNEKEEEKEEVYMGQDGHYCEVSAGALPFLCQSLELRE